MVCPLLDRIPLLARGGGGCATRSEGGNGWSGRRNLLAELTTPALCTTLGCEEEHMTEGSYETIFVYLLYCYPDLHAGWMLQGLHRRCGRKLRPAGPAVARQRDLISQDRSTRHTGEAERAESRKPRCGTTQRQGNFPNS